MIKPRFAKPPSPRQLLPSLPRLALKPLTSAPFPLQRSGLRAALQLLFQMQLTSGEMDFLQGKWLRLEIRDIAMSWRFSCSPQQQVMMQKDGYSDACIRGELASFILLAAGKEDPDTLFFQRQLIIEGDTELGLALKNQLDSVDWDALPRELLFILRSAGEFVTLFPVPG